MSKIDEMHIPTKACQGCPFNEGWTEEATKLQDLGCLPDKFWILKEKDSNNYNWNCHSNTNKVCGGLSERRDTSTGDLIGFAYFEQPIDLMEES